MTQEVTVIDLSKMSAVELKKECKERSLKVSGTKAELIERYFLNVGYNKNIVNLRRSNLRY